MAGGDDAALPVPLHPEQVDGEPLALRWVCGPDVLAFVGRPRTVPAPLQALLDEAVVADLVVEPTAVLVRLPEPHTWRADGPRVRTALQQALAEPAGWLSPEGSTSADVLTAAVDEVLGGEVGDYIRSHGGRIEVVSITGNRVEVALHGACAHCPASDSTLTDRVEGALRARYPQVEAVVGHTGAGRHDDGPGGGRHWLSLTPLRRG